MADNYILSKIYTERENGHKLLHMCNYSKSVNTNRTSEIQIKKKKFVDA